MRWTRAMSPGRGAKARRFSAWSTVALSGSGKAKPARLDIASGAPGTPDCALAQPLASVKTAIVPRSLLKSASRAPQYRLLVDGASARGLSLPQ